MNGIFVTGTDTGVGKTIVCGLLAGFLAKRGYSVITQKWVQTGSKGISGDIDSHLKLMQRKRKDVKDYLPYISIYNFAFASSPHLAAALKKIRIRKDKIKKGFRLLSERFDYVIVEGSGGALVPFNRKDLLIDITKELGLAVLIVATNKLGAINHSLLTIEALKKRNIRIIGIIFNHCSREVNKVILKDNPRIVKALTGIKILGALPWLKDKTLLYQAFAPIGKKIFTTKEPS